VRYQNLTPHPVKLHRPGGSLTLPGCARGDVPYVALEYGPGQPGPLGVVWCEARPWVHLLPDKTEGVTLIVPSDVALLAALAGRADVRTPWLGAITPTTSGLARMDVGAGEPVAVSADHPPPEPVRMGTVRETPGEREAEDNRLGQALRDEGATGDVL
jgi:hypothetical protein